MIIVFQYLVLATSFSTRFVTQNHNKKNRNSTYYLEDHKFISSKSFNHQSEIRYTQIQADFLHSCLLFSCSIYIFSVKIKLITRAASSSDEWVWPQVIHGWAARVEQEWAGQVGILIPWLTTRANLQKYWYDGPYILSNAWLFNLCSVCSSCSSKRRNKWSFEWFCYTSK